MLKTRLKTALIIVPLALLCIYLSVFTRVAIGLLIYALINYEFLSFATSLSRQRKIQFILGLLLIPCGFLWKSWAGFSAGIIFASILTFLFQLIDLETSEHLQPFEKRIPAVSLVLTYSGILGSLFVICAYLFPASSIVYVICLVAATDTFAYFVGKLIGGPKFSPRISPNKTIAGVVGGVLAASLISPLIAPYFLPSSTWVLSFFIGLLTSFLAIFGDLLESCMKRIYQAKDSGTILPGHGGVLDRVDGLMLALLVLFFLQ